MPEPPVRIAPMGEAALLVTLGEEIDPGLSARARAIATSIDGDPRLGRAIPAYASVLARFDPAELSTDHATSIVSSIVAGVSAVEEPTAFRRLVEIPVRYGDDDGPDLADVAALHDLTPADVVELHAGAEYTAFFIGFAPGFAYLGPVPASIATPRLEAPRPRVPAGSVAIGGVQTAVYPTETPGGWRLIGRTDARIWDITRTEPALIRPGDRVRFVPVT